ATGWRSTPSAPERATAPAGRWRASPSRSSPRAEPAPAANISCNRPSRGLTPPPRGGAPPSPFGEEDLDDDSRSMDGSGAAGGRGALPGRGPPHARNGRPAGVEVRRLVLRRPRRGPGPL